MSSLHFHVVAAWLTARRTPSPHIPLDSAPTHHQQLKVRVRAHAHAHAAERVHPAEVPHLLIRCCTAGLADCALQLALALALIRATLATSLCVSAIAIPTTVSMCTCCPCLAPWCYVDILSILATYCARSTPVAMHGGCGRPCVLQGLDLHQLQHRSWVRSTTPWSTSCCAWDGVACGCTGAREGPLGVPALRACNRRLAPRPFMLSVLVMLVVQPDFNHAPIACRQWQSACASAQQETQETSPQHAHRAAPMQSCGVETGPHQHVARASPAAPVPSCAAARCAASPGSLWQATCSHPHPPRPPCARPQTDWCLHVACRIKRTGALSSSDPRPNTRYVAGCTFDFPKDGRTHIRLHAHRERLACPGLACSSQEDQAPRLLTACNQGFNKINDSGLKPHVPLPHGLMSWTDVGLFSLLPKIHYVFNGTKTSLLLLGMFALLRSALGP